MESGNKYLVSMRGHEVVILNPNCRILSKDDALNMAAWLFTMSGKTNEELKLMIEETQK